MPQVNIDAETSTTSRPKVVTYTSSTGQKVQAPASAIVSQTPAGTIVVTETTTPAKTVMKYAPFLAGAALLFFFLRRK
jgi:ABC-type hemin transport system substrate-binding protein